MNFLFKEGRLIYMQGEQSDLIVFRAVSQIQQHQHHLGK